MVQFGAFWGLRRAFLTNENPFCQNNVDSAAYSRIGSYAPAFTHQTTLYRNCIHILPVSVIVVVAAHYVNQEVTRENDTVIKIRTST